VQAPMRSRASSPGQLLSDTKVCGRRVTCKAPLAHLEGGSDRSEVSPTAILQDTHSLEGKYRSAAGFPSRTAPDIGPGRSHIPRTSSAMDSRKYAKPRSNTYGRPWLRPAALGHYLTFPDFFPKLPRGRLLGNSTHPRRGLLCFFAPSG
jgi:hypothetical protein